MYSWKGIIISAIAALTKNVKSVSFKERVNAHLPDAHDLLPRWPILHEDLLLNGARANRSRNRYHVSYHFRLSRFLCTSGSSSCFDRLSENPAITEQYLQVQCCRKRQQAEASDASLRRLAKTWGKRPQTVQVVLANSYNLHSVPELIRCNIMVISGSHE